VYPPPITHTHTLPQWFTPAWILECLKHAERRRADPFLLPIHDDVVVFDRPLVQLEMGAVASPGPQPQSPFHARSGGLSSPFSPGRAANAHTTLTPTPSSSSASSSSLRSPLPSEPSAVNAVNLLQREYAFSEGVQARAPRNGADTGMLVESVDSQKAEKGWLYDLVGMQRLGSAARSVPLVVNVPPPPSASLCPVRKREADQRRSAQ
jgi:hypothetical protein